MHSLLAFSAGIGEGSMADWSGIYLHTELGTSLGHASFGYAVFSVAMLAGRLLGGLANPEIRESALYRHRISSRGSGPFPVAAHTLTSGNDGRVCHSRPRAFGRDTQCFSK